MTRGYKDLIVWQKAMDLVVEVYEVTKGLPKYETYGLSSQMQRSAVSIPSNIAEGYRREGKDTRRFFIIAYGSGSELETQLELLERLYGSSVSRAWSLLQEVMKMLYAMIYTKK
jgi:four helix bundle protein